MTRAARGAVPLTPPVLGGSVVLGGSPVITPGVWSRNGTSRLYTLKRAGVAVPSLSDKSKAELEAYAYVEADTNLNVTIEERALLGGVRVDSNALFGYLFKSIGLLTTSNNWSMVGTDPLRPDGSTTFTLAVGWRKITANATNLLNQTYTEAYLSNGGGFRMNILDANGVSGTTRQIAYGVSSAPATVFTTSSQGFAYSPTQNLIQRSVMTIGGGVLSTYRNASLINSVAITGYTVADTTRPFIIGALSGTADEVEILWVSISETNAMDASAISSYDAAVTAFGSRQVSSPSHHWEAADIVGSSWTDQVAGAVLTRSGSPVVRSFTPVFE